MTECLDASAHARALAALRPRGDAWRNGGADDLAGSVMGQFFDALGAPHAAMNARLCALIDEFFCSSAVETRDLWALEYGLPDGCDPFADICEKVNAVGDTTPDYVIAAALRRGWSITIDQVFTTRAEAGVAGVARAGVARCGARSGVTWFVTVDRSTSPAFVSPRFRTLRAGRARAGQFIACDPSLDPLTCLVRRIAPAHADLIFAAVGDPPGPPPEPPTLDVSAPATALALAIL